ncbi:uncharacterized protein LAESUDRAFT_679540 [Laetiporus sulphureus 93-53]|uniref:RGS domain-containing protein n=1 Tax=Laetiporus sulphureus 93-53 TaxID=1314785 RepID=A0A165E9J6_9APHY|nr:uncharacterized protein LAESUDRAFT_679540 [Laetiporus sulphureus 93-53]KZT06530.1 hypothetical protein LAESUDRAFT_679540 [Laetiporus sulphureus 93-53]
MARSQMNVLAKCKRAVWDCTRKLFGRRQLSDITLAHVLSGDTCEPISLREFETYLAHKEHTIEILHFVVWFQDYRQRFLALPRDVQATTSGYTSFTFAIPSAARTAQRIADSKRRAEVLRYSGDTSICAGPSSSLPSAFSVRSDSQVPEPVSPYARSSAETPLLQQLESIGSTPRELPFRDECRRVIATFFRPGAASELPLDHLLRDTVVRDLTWNTHPDIFLHVYEEMYALLETVSLPRFLAIAATNINTPKQLYWYAIGIADVFIGIIIALVCITVVHVPPKGNRAWRLFAVPFFAFGVMQVYSAYRGFCSQVWGRGHTQVRVWEMQEMDEEAAAHCEHVLRLEEEDDDKKDKSSIRKKGGGDPDKARVEMAEHVAWGTKEDMDAIAPFEVQGVSSSSASIPIRDARLKPKRSTRWRGLKRLFQTVDDDRRPSTPDGSEEAFPRPPVFGPEKVVLDPRIRAVHREILRDLLYVGFWATSVSIDRLGYVDRAGSDVCGL